MLRDLFSLFPAYAGVIPHSCRYYLRICSFPRIRGGDPDGSDSNKQAINFSPHTRG